MIHLNLYLSHYASSTISCWLPLYPGRRPAFRVFPCVWISSCSSLTHSVSDRHVRRKSGRSGGSGLFPAIKTALVDVCHEFKTCNITILKSYGELGLGWPRKDGPTNQPCLVRIRTPQNSAFVSPTNTPAAGRTPRVILVNLVFNCLTAHTFLWE